MLRRPRRRARAQVELEPVTPFEPAAKAGEGSLWPSLAMRGTKEPPGAPLDAESRAYFEPRFARDLSEVRVHTGGHADESARGINALAYTSGSDIVFADGQYVPSSDTGRRLIAHELAHIAQQDGAAGASGAPGMGHRGDPHEREADRVSAAVGRGEHVGGIMPISSKRIQRAEDDSWMGTASKFWGSLKEQAYTAMIDGMRGAQAAGSRTLRRLTTNLAPWQQVVASMVIDQLDLTVDLVISLVLAVTGLVVGFVSGIARALWGLLAFIEGIFEWMILWLAQPFGEEYRDRYMAMNRQILAGLSNIGPALRMLWDRWRAEWDKASADRRTLMIGEVFGEIEAILASLAGGGAAVDAAGEVSLTMAPARELAFAMGAGGSRAAGGATTVTMSAAGPVGGGLAGAMAMSVTERADEAAAESRGRASKVEPYEKEFERKKLEPRATAEGEQARNQLARDIKRRMPGDPKRVKVEIKRIERTEAGRGQIEAVTPEGTGVAMEDEFVITLEDGTKFNADGFQTLPSNPKKYLLLEHKEVLTVWERSHFARDVAVHELDLMLNRHADIFLKLEKSGCAGFQYSTNSAELANLLAERIALMRRSGVRGLIAPPL